MKAKKKAAKRIAFSQLHDLNSNQPISVYTHGGRDYPTPNGMPSKFNIYGQSYTVRYHSYIYSAANKNQRLSGLVSYPHRLIIIDPKASIHDMRETLYHEVCHVYLKVWQTKSECLSTLSDSAVENVCDMFGEAIYDLALNNVLPRHE